MKPVNLNQLLFHDNADSLSFFVSPLKRTHNATLDEGFLQELSHDLKASGKEILSKLLTKYHSDIKKIIKAHPDKSHGFFISEELHGYTILQNAHESYHIVGQRFHLRPLLEELFVNPEFILVNISLYDIKIFKGDFQHLENIQQYEFADLPHNFVELKARFFTPQYIGMVPYKSFLAIKAIAEKVKETVMYESLPVVVTGLEEMKNLFLRYFGDTGGVITHIQADFYEKSCMEILERCGEFRFAVTDYYSAQLKDRLKRLMKSNRILSDLKDIIPAACDGRVIHLVIPSEQKIWGKLDLEKGEFTIHKKAGKTSVDILNELAEEVIKQGGKISILPPHFFPYRTNVLAVIKGQL